MPFTKETAKILGKKGGDNYVKALRLDGGAGRHGSIKRRKQLENAVWWVTLHDSGNPGPNALTRLLQKVKEEDPKFFTTRLLTQVLPEPPKEMPVKVEEGDKGKEEELGVGEALERVRGWLGDRKGVGKV